MIFQGKRAAPDQLETKINRNIVPIKGTQGQCTSNNIKSLGFRRWNV
ncbi:hypothetical protein BVRB_2g042910 [Beta vulgaris subsp. vulgaris]|nr:hypothetical protein BVRB_2g042910 [Beta vulgaris subsp. vulgaris]